MIYDPVGNDTRGAALIGFDKLQHKNCSEVLWQNLTRNPDKLAVIGPSGHLTYRELTEEAARWGRAFSSFGLKRGERIAFFLDDTPVYPAAFFGAVRAGFVPVLLNVLSKQEMLNYYLTDSGARIALVDAPFIEVFGTETLKGTQVELVVITNGDCANDGVLKTEEFLAGQPTELERSDTHADDMAFWMYSSGSTGRPKGIVHLHHDMAYTHASYGKHVLALEAQDIVFSVPKIYFAYGFGNSITFPFSVGAAALLLPGRPKPNLILDAIEKYRPTVFFGLPTLYTALARAVGVADRDLSSLRLSISAAEILSADIYSSWKNLVGHGPTEGLGSTEMLHIYLSNRHDDHRLSAAGAAVPGYEIRLVSLAGNPVSSDEEGVMLLRGDSSAPCYWNRPKKTAETMQGDWINTGDLFVEREGFYYFQGRSDDLVKVSGQWVWPMEVERCLNEHEEVHEAAVLAVTLSDRRMALKAVVSLKTRCKPSDEKTVQLRDYIKSKLAPFKSPRIFHFIDELPKTGTGKIDRQQLKHFVGDSNS